MPVDIFEAENIDFDNKSNPVDVFEAENISPKKNKKVSFLPTREELNKAEKDFSKMSGEVLRETPYYAQGAVKEPFKMANVLLPENYQVPINKLKLAEKVSPNVGLPERKEAESLGGLLGMGAPRAGIMGGLKAAQGIPHIGNVIKKAMEASPILNKLFDVGGKGAEFGLYEAAEHPENQLGAGALGFGLGAGLSGLGYGIPAVARKLGYGKTPGEETIQGLSYEKLAPTIEASERLDVPLTPAETSGSPFIGGLQGRYTRTREAAAENVEKGMERYEKEKKSINKLLDTIYDKSELSNNKVRDLYNTAYKWNMKPDVINKLKSDPLIEDAFDKVANDKVWQRKMAGKPENNFAYLDKVRKELSDQESKLIKSGEKSKAAEYTDARNNLVDVMDQSYPAYKQARQEAQKSIIRSQIQKKISKSEIKGSEFYKKIIRNEDEFEKLHSSLKNVPEAQKMLQDMKLTFKNLINVEKPGTSSYQSEKAINQARNWADKAIETYNKFFGKKKNLESVKFIRGDAWVKKLRDAQKTGKKEDVEKAVNDIMIKILPVSDFLIEGNKE